MTEGKDEKQKDICSIDTGVCDLLVSVSCISFNHGRYIRDALEGFLKQETDFDFEILIHDDASTDDTVDIIKEYASRFPDIIKPLFEKDNQYSRGISNPSGVFNFPRARGKYIAMCEGDDVWTDPAKLQKQADFMEAHSDFSLCLHSAGIINEAGSFRVEKSVRPYRSTRELSPEEIISKRSDIPTCSLFFRTDCVRDLPGWYFDCPVGDEPLQMFLASRGRVWYFDEIMGMYRKGSVGSWSESMDAGGEKLWEDNFIATRTLYTEFDAFTSFRWHEAVLEALTRKRFLLDLKEGKASVVLKPENKKFVSELPPLEQGLQRLKARVPFLYTALRRIYYILKKVKA